MDSWITVVLTLLVIALPAIGKLRKQMNEPPGKKFIDLPYEEDDHESELVQTEAQDLKSILERRFNDFDGSGSVERIDSMKSVTPEIAQEEFNFFSEGEISGDMSESEKKKVKHIDIDKKKLIIYSEILKAKYSEF
jgi:hypothetical protein